MGTDGGFQGREGGQRDGSEGKGEDQSGGYGSICWGALLGSALCSRAASLRLCPGRGAGVGGSPLPHKARRDAQCDCPLALSIPGNLPCTGKTSRHRSKLHPSVVK